MEKRNDESRLNPNAVAYVPTSKFSPHFIFIPRFPNDLPSPLPHRSFTSPYHPFPQSYPYHQNEAPQYIEALPKPKVMMGFCGEVIGGPRFRNRNRNLKLFPRYNKRYAKEGFSADHRSQSSKKLEWRVKCSSVNNENHMNVQAGSVDNDKTTLMIRNIPNRLTREMLKNSLDQQCLEMNQKEESNEEELWSAFDFLYLPIDFGTKANKGYAFVNFTNPKAVRKFFDAWNGKRWDCFQSNKIREICFAKVQGLEQLLQRFKKMEFPSEDFQPVTFNPARNGSKQEGEETKVGRCTDMALGPRAIKTKSKHKLMT
ncbi:RNA recognition motif 2 [Corchorus olitorius]|uniref:RNA recognition motif 2 n=1 Tax=Corchorus olitorius TaxID=93759 RepID=A0A1R3HZ21_9ROSI|nr:RNA recognition motif 2 [Corchorus olitorius]